MKKVLLTSVGSLAGLSTLQCLQDIRDRIKIIGLNSDPGPAHMFGCDKLYLVEKTSDIQYEPSLKKILDAERPDLIIPCRDEEIEVLGKLSRHPDYAGSVFFAPGNGLASIFNDKYETWKFSLKHHLPFPETAYNREEANNLIQKKGFPLVAKPRFCGHASKGVFIVTNRVQLNNIVREQRFVIQEILNPATLGKQIESKPDFGRPWSSTVTDHRVAAETVIDRGGRIISLSTVESDTSGPLSMKMSVIDHPGVTAVAEAWAGKLAENGYFGVLNLQGKLLPDGEFVPFELNARFTGSAVARKYLGYNQVAHAVQYFLFGKEPWPNHRAGNHVSVSRSPYYVTAQTKDIEELAENKEWTKNGK